MRSTPAPRRAASRRVQAAASLAIVFGLLAAAPALAASAKAGQALAQRNCAACHAIGAKGASPNREAPPFRTLHDRYPVEFLAESLAEGIMSGHPAMPQFRFSTREINDLIAYLKTLEPRDAGLETRRGLERVGLAGEPLAGRQVPTP